MKRDEEFSDDVLTEANIERTNERKSGRRENLLVEFVRRVTVWSSLFSVRWKPTSTFDGEISMAGWETRRFCSVFSSFDETRTKERETSSLMVIVDLSEDKQEKQNTSNQSERLISLVRRRKKVDLSSCRKKTRSNVVVERRRSSTD